MTAAATTRLPACMGGWCTRRESCGRHHQAERRDAPAERLCRTGRRRNAWIPIAKEEKHAFEERR